MGAGFLVDPSGVIVTNWHVTNKADEVFVWVLPDDGPVSIDQMFKNVEPYFGLVFADDKKKDLSLVKVNGLPKDLNVIEFGANNDIDIGDTVFAIGHPSSFPWTITEGKISQIRKNHIWTYADGTEHQATLIQHQVPISPGSSGGPLFNDKILTKLVGVNTLGGDGQNLNFSVSVDHVKQFLKDNPNVKNINPVGALINKDYPKILSGVNTQRLENNPVEINI